MFKIGNAAILRGGKEALYSNRALASVIENALKQTDVPACGTANSYNGQRGA